jgi:hypothetical protein
MIMSSSLPLPKCGVEKRGVLVNPIISETGAAKVYTFLCSEFELHIQVGTPSQLPNLVCCFLPEVGDFRCSDVALLSCWTRRCDLLNDFDEAGL